MDTAVVPQESKGFVATLFGQFASREFWKDLFALIVREAVSSFISVLGGTLIYAVQQRTSEQSSSIRKIAGVGGPAPTAPAPLPATGPGAAFSSGYRPQPSYAPAVASAGTPQYPGFPSP